MKKIISLILALCMVMSFVTHVGAENSEKTQESAFVTVKIPFPDSIENYQSWLVRARYIDSGEIIPLSLVYEGEVYATVPVENKNRAIEAFVAESLEFSDVDDSDFDFHDVKMLSGVGVIKGNDKGEANIHDNVTRAEAVAMVMRFMGLEGLAWEYLEEISGGYTQTATFEDVSKKDWFYYVVNYARNCGIIEGDSPSVFSPYRNVTREEITVMVARALQYADLRCFRRQNENLADKENISEWAREAYDYVGYNYIADYPQDTDNIDWDNPPQFLYPQKAATRANVAYILNHIQDECQMYASELAKMFGFDKEMPIIDGSTSTYPFTQVVYNTLFRNGQTHPQYPQSHSKSHASYQRLINGEVDMLFASVYPASDILKMAEEKGVELELIPIAYDAMIFFTNNDNPITGLTKEQITNIYVNDAYDNWSEVGGSDALLYPYCRNNDSGSHAQMEKHFLNGNEIHPEVQKETSFTMSNVLTDVIAAKTDNPTGYGLGYSIYYYYHNVDAVLDTKRHLKLLSIDGVMPTDETIADGSYPLSNNTYVVLRKDTPADAPARKMAEFMLTEAGQVCVEGAGFGRLKKKTEISEDMLFADKVNTQMPTDKNYMFSPISIKMALALAANGASGETQAEILNALGISSIDDFNQLSKDLIKRYSQTDILSLDIANSIWINKDKTPQQFGNGFKNIAEEFYNADANTVADALAVSEINSWVNDKTNGKIPTIIDNTNDFWAMLINAVYFKGAWQDEFNANATKPDQFNNADGTKITVDFMNMQKWFPYAKTNSVHMIELPYRNRVENFSEDGEYIGTDKYDDLDVSMYLIMSENDVNVEQELSAAINDDTFKSTYIKMSMPKFKVEYSTDLNKIFMNMGITTAFNEKNADFTKMFNSGNMWFTKTIHKTFIDVDEKGTEAAAVTSIGMGGSSLPPEPIELKFNKPFYFAIRDNTSGETLFMGRYAFANQGN